MYNDIITRKPEWKSWLTPKLLKDAPIHRWLVFPHSFSRELIYDVINLIGLYSEDNIFDPFCGAGTTLLSSKEIGIASSGCDISPYAVFTSNVKNNQYKIECLENDWSRLQRELKRIDGLKCTNVYPDLVLKSFSQDILGAIDYLNCFLETNELSIKYKNFFKLALFSVMPLFSKALATGGWLKWQDNDRTVDEFCKKYSEKINMMIEDVRNINCSHLCNVSCVADARYLPVGDNQYSAIITSPPYPNRHDYTRVFGIELMFGFLDWEKTRALRYQSFHSHPEARPIRPEYNNYSQPQLLTQALCKIKKYQPRKRIITMLEGYFIDMYCVLRELGRICKKNGHIVLVLGNAQYYGIPLLVDEIVASIGEQVGLKCKNIIAARERGNSAQQMKKFGRCPSRESVIIFQN